MFAGEFAPKGWLFCEGQTLKVSDHTPLFSLIGNPARRVQTFELPDLRDRAPIGTGAGQGLSQRPLREPGGASSTTIRGVTAHGHEIALNPAAGSTDSPHGASIAGVRPPGFANTTRVFRKIDAKSPREPADEVMHPGTVTEVGDGQPHPVMPPYLGLRYIICVSGEYPMRD